MNIMTICNTGRLACGPLGTALGVITHLHQTGRLEKAWVSETRPYLQGIRLTSFELTKEGIKHDIFVEGASSYIMEHEQVDAIFVGADRIVANGDTANKIGTANLSILAKYYDIPFYVVAPSSSFDLNTASGKEIVIEQRDMDEILSCQSNRLAPEGATAYNPSFDITHHENITGIICEKGIIHNPNEETVKRVVL